MRHLSQQLLGDAPLFEHVSKRLKSELSLVGRGYLEGLARERTGLRYNDIEGAVLLINARLNPLTLTEKFAKVKPGSVVIDRGKVAVAAMRSADVKKATESDGTVSQKKLLQASKSLDRLESEDILLFDYPWDFLGANGRAIEWAAGRAEKRLLIRPGAEVEDFVSFDTSEGPVIVDEGATIEAFSRISGPCYIGKGSIIRSALVRSGTTVAEGCRLGGEVDNSIVYRRTNKAHFGFLGHSIVGEWVNIGAAAVTSDLKNTYGSVRVMRGADRVDTGLLKLGAMVGDMAKVSIGCMIYCGKTLGVAARCEGLVENDVPDFANYSKSSLSRLDLAQVIKTQQRVKSRRREDLTSEERRVIEHVYAHSS
jgi:UDP-N-acetylglucosamine diphosphorylase/glucosamine-1-phosphate N-acetyltransferase